MSDNEVFSIKDPRPVTAKFRGSDHPHHATEVYFSDSTEVEEMSGGAMTGGGASSGEVREGVRLRDMEGDDEGMGDGEEEDDEDEGEDKGFREATKGAGAKHEAKGKGRTKKERSRRKGKQRVSAYNSTSLSSIYIRSSEVDSKTRIAERHSRSEQVITEPQKRKPKRKKKSPPQPPTTIHPQPPTTTVVLPAEEAKPDLGSSETSHSSRKPNLDRIAKLSEHRRCKLEQQESWFNPNLAIPPTTTEEQMTVEDAARAEPKHTTSSPGVEVRRPRVRYTNLSLSMPTSREYPATRRKEGEEPYSEAPGHSWLFECRNIWSNPRHGHFYGHGGPYSGAGQGYYTGSQNVEVTGTVYRSNVASVASSSLSSSCKTNSRFIHSMKTRNTKRSAPMRTVKQGSFVLLGTVKTIRDDRIEKLLLNLHP